MLKDTAIQKAVGHHGYGVVCITDLYIFETCTSLNKPCDGSGRMTRLV
jgi:hypothetical protein